MTANDRELKDKDFYPERTLVRAVFPEEEGARFRVSCLGSRLMAGAMAPDAALAPVPENLAGAR